MYRDILLAYDGSPASREALTQCRSLAINGRANIHLVAVVGPELYQFPVDGMTVHLNHSRQEITADLRKGQAELSAYGLDVRTRLCFGNPAEQIIAIAREIHADLIVVGHRNQSALARWWNGSVDGSIVDGAPCSVLVAVNTPINLARSRREHGRDQPRLQVEPPASLRF
jgi:nucleotide-binding universal stress UspA family protein